MGKKLSILFISEYFPPKVMGGGEINLFLMTKALVKHHINVVVLTSIHENLKEFEVMEGVKVYRKLKTGTNASSLLNNLKRSVCYPKSIIKETKILLQEINIDLIHFIGTGIIASKKLYQLNKPMVATIESYPTMCPKGDRLYNGTTCCEQVCSFQKFISCQMQSTEIGKMKNKWFIKYNPAAWIFLYSYYKKLNKSLKYTNQIAISKYLQLLLEQHKSKSTVIPNMINTNKFFKQKNKNKKTKILYLGELIKFKGPQVLLEALKGTDYECTIYGKGILKNELENTIKKYNLNAKIYPVVEYDNIPKIYAENDVVIFPSIWPEPFGRISIEAMAAGKPVIGSKVGGISETIEEGTGVLVEPNNPIELTKAIKKILTTKFNNKKSQETIKKYEEEIIIKKLIKIYNIFLEK